MLIKLLKLEKKLVYYFTKTAQERIQKYGLVREGVKSGEGLCPSATGIWGCAPQNVLTDYG